MKIKKNRTLKSIQSMTKIVVDAYKSNPDQVLNTRILFRKKPLFVSRVILYLPDVPENKEFIELNKSNGGGQ